MVCRPDREIGISGYFASERILTPKRVELLGIAGIRSTESDCTSPLDAIASLMLLALSAAERALASLDSGDHIHLAHVHLLMAAELIADGSGWNAKLLQVDQWQRVLLFLLLLAEEASRCSDEPVGKGKRRCSSRITDRDADASEVFDGRRYRAGVT